MKAIGGVQFQNTRTCTIVDFFNYGGNVPQFLSRSIDRICKPDEAMGDYAEKKSATKPGNATPGMLLDIRVEMVYQGEINRLK